MCPWLCAKLMTEGEAFDSLIVLWTENAVSIQLKSTFTPSCVFVCTLIGRASRFVMKVIL